MKPGDIVTILARATVLRVSNAHGECAEVELVEQLDFREPRTVWVGTGELAGSLISEDLLLARIAELEAGLRHAMERCERDMDPEVTAANLRALAGKKP